MTGDHVSTRTWMTLLEESALLLDLGVDELKIVSLPKFDQVNPLI